MTRLPQTWEPKVSVSLFQLTQTMTSTSSGAATKGRHSVGTLSVEGKQTAPGSRSANPSTPRNQKKMEASGSTQEEDMDWEMVQDGKGRPQPHTSGDSFDVTAFMNEDHKSPASLPTPTAGRGRNQAAESDLSSVDKGQGQDTPSTAGGEGQLNDPSDSQDSDSGGDVDNQLETDPRTQKPSRYDTSKAWKGVPMKHLKTTPYCLPADLKLERSGQHYIAIRTPFEYRRDRIPAPMERLGQWDTDHVRMPFTFDSKCLVNGKEEKRWDVITRALQPLAIRGPYELEEAILKYNQRYVNKWKFRVLHHFFIKHVDIEQREEFFENLLPEMIQLALSLPDICPLPIPLLKKGKAKKLTLSQHQISCLLANAFFCTFPLRNARTRATEYSDYPDINFSHLFIGDPVPRKLQKLHCIIHYFKRVFSMPRAGIVTFSRQVLPGPHKWLDSMETLSQLHVSSTGTIEDNGQGMLQVDFANKYLGGGVLGHGCVQEEIRFLICPEMIITRLFTQSLDPMESLLMTGCERYSDYEGYSDTFRWTRDYLDNTPRDYLGRLCCDVVAIDAQVFRSDYNKQFRPASIDRELNKAYCGFKSSANEDHRAAVCTGNWGCGAFGGDKQLKALIQVMAASVAKRDVCYFTFDDEQLTKDLFEVHDQLKRKDKTVGEVYSLLDDYSRMMGGFRSRTMPLFEFIHSQLHRHQSVSRPVHLHHTPVTHNDYSGSDNSSWFDRSTDHPDII